MDQNTLLYGAKIGFEMGLFFGIGFFVASGIIRFIGRYILHILRDVYDFNL